MTILPFLILLTCAATPSPPMPHALYVSVIEIRQQQGNHAMMTVKVFSDDLLNAIRNDIRAQKPMYEDSICTAYRDEAMLYFTEHLVIRVNDTPALYTMTRCLVKGGSHWLSFRIEAPARWETVQISADYFLELFPTQSNVLTLHANGEKWTSRFNQKNPAQEFRINR